MHISMSSNHKRDAQACQPHACVRQGKACSEHLLLAHDRRGRVRTLLCRRSLAAVPLQPLVQAAAGARVGAIIYMSSPR